MEVCANRSELRGVLAHVDGRMAWSGNSEVAKGLNAAMRMASEVEGHPSLVFLTDGQESPPLSPSRQPRFDGKPGEVPGVVVGVGGPVPLPIPKTDPAGRALGVWHADEVMQTDPFSRSRAGSMANEALAGDAAQAQPGQYLGVGGPRGSFVIPRAFDWHMLIGDDTALPAIGRRIEELGPDARVIVVAEVADESARIPLATGPHAEVHWIHRDEHRAEDGEPASEGSQLVPTLRWLSLPAGEGYVWAAGEGAAMRDVRQYLVEERGIHKTRIRASAYWKRGNAAVHETVGCPAVLIAWSGATFLESPRQLFVFGGGTNAQLVSASGCTASNAVFSPKRV